MSTELDEYIEAKEDLTDAIRRGDKALEEFQMACALYAQLSDADVEELKRRMKEPIRG